MNIKNLFNSHIFLNVMSTGLFSTFLCLFVIESAFAVVSSDELSWTNKLPIVSESTVIHDMTPGLCTSTYQNKEISGMNGLKKVCIKSGENVKFGVFYAEYSFLGAVGFKYDTKMYRVNGVCGQYDNCLYLPDSDTLVTKQNLINGFVRSLVVYKNFTNRLTPVIKFGVISTLEYNFDSSNPDYTLRSSDGYAWPIGGVGESQDGNWLAVELRQRGIGLLNVNTLEMRRVSDISFRYGVGSEPITELTVSNNGRHIAVAGVNSGLFAIDVIDNCGDVIDENTSMYFGEIMNKCNHSELEFSNFIYRFSQAFRPRLNESGGELGFYATSYTGEIRQVSLRVDGYVKKRLDYLALGDSYSSGEGEVDDNYYLDGTNNEFEKCHNSTRSYPYLIANYLSIEPAYMKSVACSGAVIGDIVGGNLSYDGQGDRLGKDKLKLSDVDKILYQTEAEYFFIPGRIYQTSFIKNTQPKVITIGIGGNDTGFMSILASCVSPKVCQSANDNIKKEQSAIEIKKLFDKLVQAYQEINDVSPNSKIYAIGYPRIIDQNQPCDALLGNLLDPIEREYINEGVIYLNQVIKAAAKRAGIKYIDIQESYGNHVLCGLEPLPAMNAIKLGDDNTLFDSFEKLKIIGQESFHPNALGHFYAASSIMQSVENIMIYNYCEDGRVICPDIETIAPEPSNYWIPDGYHNYPTRQLANFVSDRDSSDNYKKNIKLGTNSLKPNSSVEIIVTSDPISMGHFTVSNDGSLDVDIDLPVELEYGYHTINLAGLTFSNELIELYQVVHLDNSLDIEVEKSNNNSNASQNINKISDMINKPTIITLPKDDGYLDVMINMAPIISNTGTVKGVSVREDDLLDKSIILRKVPNDYSRYETIYISFGLIGLLTILIIKIKSKNN